MIKNDKQLSLNEKRLESLLEMANEYKEATSLLDKGQHSVLVSQAKKVKSEINEYRKFQSSSINDLKFDLDNIHKSIVALRIASRLTQKELAEKTGLQEQQIQRYEDQDYEKASFERIIQIISTMADDINLSFVKKGIHKKIRFENIDPQKLPFVKELREHKSMLDIMPMQINCG